jgi:hypothetical protein
MADLGARLQLLVGPTLPLPAPYPLIEAFVGLEVTNRDRDFDGFQLTFSLGKESPLDYGLLLSGLLDPPSRVVVVMLIGVLPEVLIDGVITNHQVVPSNRPGESSLVVTGLDISVMLDLEEKNETHPNQPDSVIVTKLLATYARFGLTPLVTPTTDIPIQVNRIPTQQGSDLAYIRELARRNGFVFYVEPTPVPGVSQAYWGIDNRLGVPQPALTMNMGADTNVDQPISFNFNALGPATPQVRVIEPISRMAIPVPVPGGLRPPLASRPASSLRTTIARDTANLNPAQGALRALSSAEDSADAVTGTGEVDAVRYGRALRARRLVGVRGVGFSYDGNYYVQEVAHRVRRGEYKQRFTLKREGRGAATPLVIP